MRLSTNNFNIEVKSMKKFALIGYPLGHSMSPLIHKELFKICGTDADYELKEIEPSALESSVNALEKLDGFNVTIPHKINIIPHLNSLSHRAELFGAVNTVDIKNGEKTGHNTDCEGFLRALEMAGIKLAGEVLLCGSGGVSRMFAFETVLAGADLTIAVREADIAAANQIKNEIESKLSREVNIIRLNDVCGEYDLLINGTPVGMYPNIDSCVLSENQVKKCSAVFDAVYNPLETKLISCAKQTGLKYSNGLPMLVWQAAVAQEIWLGVKFTTQQVRSVIKTTERELKK